MRLYCLYCVLFFSFLCLCCSVFIFVSRVLRFSLGFCRGYFCIGFGECAIEDNMYVVGYRPDHYNRQPLKPAVPSGSVTGNITTLYYYETIAVDPDGDSLFYQYDWGDGNVSDWLGPITANSTASAYHQWRMQGRYQIRARCCDVFGSISSWSDPLIISVPIDHSTNSIWCRLHSLLTSLLGGRGFMPHY